MLHGQKQCKEVPAWESCPVVLLLPCVGWMGKQATSGPAVGTSSWGGVARLQELCSAEFFCPCSLNVFLVFESYHVPYKVCALGGSWEMTFSSSCPLFHLALSIVMAIQMPTSSFPSSRISNSVCMLALSLPMLLKAPWSKEMGKVVKVK